MKNRLIIAAAGSGKTTFLIKEALKVRDSNVLITTYTEDNEAEIKRKIIELNKVIPTNLTVQTWFSFLLQHGVRPYQGCLFQPEIKGMLLVNQPSGAKPFKINGRPVYYGEETELEKHYFTTQRKIYSDKISKFVIRCNEQSNGEVIGRLARIYNHIFIDEVQDLAGYDLELIRLLFESQIETLLVGDPRQVTYLTHIERKNDKYTNGRIRDFITDKTNKKVPYEIDETTLGQSHRNNAEICAFSSTLYPDLPVAEPCACVARRPPTIHEGLFLVRPADVDLYLAQYNPVQLRWSSAVETNPEYRSYNFGKSKGLSFDRVLIFPTESMAAWLKNRKTDLKDEARAKLYVSITRAKASVAFVYNYKPGESLQGVTQYVP